MYHALEQLSNRCARLRIQYQPRYRVVGLRIASHRSFVNSFTYPLSFLCNHIFERNTAASEMATQSLSASTALDEIRTLLVTNCEDPFDLDARGCIGIAEKGTNPRPCKNPRGEQRQIQAKKDKLYFSELKVYSRKDKVFCNRVELFLGHLYCWQHTQQVMGNFKLWKKGHFPPASPKTIDLSPTSLLDSVSASVLPSIEACPEYLPAGDDQTKEPTGETEDPEVLSILTKSSAEPSNVSSLEDSTLDSSVTTPDSTFHEPTDSLNNADQEREESPESDPEFERVLVEMKNKSPPNRLDEVKMECDLLRRRSRIIHHINKKPGVNDTKPGLVYALLHENGNIKVSWTVEETVEQALKQSHNCAGSDVNICYQSSKRFIGAYRVDTLVKADLRHKRLVETCDRCGSDHIWFKTNKDDVIESIKNWTTFVCGVYDADGSLNEVGQRTVDIISPASSAVVVKAYSHALAQYPIPETSETPLDAVDTPSIERGTQDVEPSGENTVDDLLNESEAGSDVRSRTRWTSKLRRLSARMSDKFHSLLVKINIKEVPEVAQGAMERIFDQDIEVSSSTEGSTNKTRKRDRLRRRSGIV
ncbi:hypothetical protein F5884DRAFT_798314 [Xylogone sp. PMI_703]|nr:hypothetical protein F5884DRAFT_798314 [Xylogone sp. PMI_703]